jgi:DNA helicase-2/ATP-dependent DNA helicase PcrA
MEDVLATDLDIKIPATKTVALMTIHLAKGLSFLMFLLGMEEDLFPSAP